MKNDLPSRVQFGTFELDLKTGELCSLRARPAGRRVLLAEQPFQVLRMLVERRGEIVTRDEIKRKLWPNDTIVDFDHSINVAIGALRRLLGDSAEKPKYIETVARRGYRLMLPVKVVEAVHDLIPSEADAIISDRPAPVPPGSDGFIGKKVSHYRVLEVIGGGGMGMVYKAEDLKLGRRVALKFLPEELANDSTSLQRFTREARTASSLNHSNICTIFGVEEYDGRPFIAMELLEGETLRDYLVSYSSKRVPLDQLLEIALQTCDGLQAAHENGIIHRDIKPANIFLTRRGVVKILDFGLAKLVESEAPAETESRGAAPNSELATVSQTVQGLDATLTSAGMAMGTASYMSPEQIRREKLDARTDLFSFGLVLYEMATGQRAFIGDSATTVHEAILTRIPKPVQDLNSAVQPGLATTIAKALQKDPIYRYQSAEAMRADLDLIRARTARRLSPIWKMAVSAFLLFIVAGGAWLYRRFHSNSGLLPNDTIVLADVDNKTGDAVFDDALNTALLVEFQQTPFFNVLAADKVRGNLKLLNHPADAKVTLEIARQVCLRTNSKAVVASTIADVGNHFRLELIGINCQTAKSFAYIVQDAASRNDIVHALGVAGSKLRSKMGEPKASIVKFSQPLEEATTASMEALQLLTEGYRNHFSSDRLAAIPFYQRAIDIDPSFALAYAALGARYSSLGEAAAGASTVKKAYELRNRLTALDRFAVESLYFALGTGELEKAYDIHMEWVQTYPADVRAHVNLANNLAYLGQFERSADEAREAVRLLPSGQTYWALMAATILANRLEDAKAVFEEAKIRGLDTTGLHELRHLLAFLQHDGPGMQEQLAWASGKNQAEALLWRESDVQAYYGRFRDARRLTQRAVDLATKTRSGIEPSHHLETDALREIEVGNLVEGERLAASALSADHNRDQRLDIALAFARTGNLLQARKLDERLDQEFPLNTLVQNYSLPAIRAAMKLHENDAATAIEILRPASRYDLAYPDSFNSLYPAYLRGIAYLQIGEGLLAAAEFQKVVDHSGIVGRFVLGALAHLQLGRAQAMMGDKSAARKSYQEFLSLWKDADSDIPIYKEAKAEYANLR